MSETDLKNELIGKYLKIIAVVALYWYVNKTKIDGYKDNSIIIHTFHLPGSHQS